MARHLTLEERERVSQMVHAHRSQAEIARRLKRHPATISRELRRNRSPNGYWAASAQVRADARRSNRPWTCKMERPEVASYVRQRLWQRWSPDEIAGRSRDDFPRDPRRRLSRQTIYTWIHAHPAAAYWRRYLPRLARVRRRGENRGRLPACVSIEGRPAVVDRRARTATGKATPWSVGDIAAAPSRWWTGKRATCCWARSVTGRRRPSAKRWCGCFSRCPCVCGRP